MLPTASPSQGSSEQKGQPTGGGDSSAQQPAQGGHPLSQKSDNSASRLQGMQVRSSKGSQHLDLEPLSIYFIFPRTVEACV